MILGGQDIEIQAQSRIGLGNLLQIGGAGCRDDRLTLEAVDVGDARALLADIAARRQVVGRREGDLLLAIGIIGRRSALKIDGPIGDERNAGCRGHRIELNLQVRHFQFILDFVDDEHADILGVAHDLLFVVVVGERNGSIAVANRDLPGFLDLLERAGELLGHGSPTDHRAGQYDQAQLQIFALHINHSLKVRGATIHLIERERLNLKMRPVGAFCTAIPELG